jgi:UDPglucose 6-dehydrogenase
MIKYASNAFLEVKIIFINGMASLCEKVGADVKAVATAMEKDG